MSDERGTNGHGPGAHDAEDDQEQDEMAGELTPGEYEQMLLVERLESLEEEMDELGVSSLDDVRRRIAELHARMDPDD